MAETQNRDTNHLWWQVSTDLGIRVSGPEYRKMEHRETLKWGCWCKNVENRYVSKKWHPSFKDEASAQLFTYVTEVHHRRLMWLCFSWILAFYFLRLCITYKYQQTCAKVPKRFEILGSLSPRSETLMDLGPCTSFLPWDSGNPGP